MLSALVSHQNCCFTVAAAADIIMNVAVRVLKMFKHAVVLVTMSTEIGVTKTIADLYSPIVLFLLVFAALVFVTAIIDPMA